MQNVKSSLKWKQVLLLQVKLVIAVVVSFGYINPSLSEDDILDIGQKIAGLQKYNLGSVNRQDTAEIAAE